jgi:hypothetical protein
MKQTEQVEQEQKEKNEPVISETIPPKIRELLRKRGWSWPPDEKLKKQIQESLERSAGSIHFDPEVIEEAHRDTEYDPY